MMNSSPPTSPHIRIVDENDKTLTLADVPDNEDKPEANALNVPMTQNGQQYSFDYHNTMTPSAPTVLNHPSHDSFSHRTDPTRTVAIQRDSVSPIHYAAFPPLRPLASVKKNMVVAESKITGTDTTLMTNIANAFNKKEFEGAGGLPAPVYAAAPSFWSKGESLQKNQFLLIGMNGVPYLQPYVKNKIIYKQWFANAVIIGKYKLIDYLIGAAGTYVLMVNEGFYAKAYADTKAMLYGPGAHIINSSHTKFDKNRDYILQSEPYINHGNIHIVSVPPGCVAKVDIGNKNSLLEDTESPYYFRSENFKLHGFVPASEKLITHGHIKRIVPPLNTIGLVRREGGIELVKPVGGKPFYLFEVTDYFISFIPMDIQKKSFPQKKKEANFFDLKDHYQAVTSADLHSIGVRLEVSYRVKDINCLVKSDKSLVQTEDGIAGHLEVFCFKTIDQAFRQHRIGKLASADAQLSGKEVTDSVDYDMLETIKTTITAELIRGVAEFGLEFQYLNFEMHPFAEKSERSLLSAYSDLLQRCMLLFRPSNDPDRRQHTLNSLPAPSTDISEVSHDGHSQNHEEVARPGRRI
jgi:hypothetical protein